MSVTADRIRFALGAPTLAALAALSALSVGHGATAAVDATGSGDDDYALTVVDQTFAVTAGESLRLDVVLAASAAGIADVQAAAATTTTSTTTLPTTTPATEPVTPAAGVPAPTAGPALPVTTAAPPTTVADADGFAHRSTPPPTTPAGEIVVTVHEPLGDAAELATVDDEGPGRPLDSTAVALADVVGAVDTAAGTATGMLSVPIGLTGDDAEALEVSAAGIHPISLELRLGGVAAATATTFVQVNVPAEASAGAPYPIAILASIPDPGPWADDDALAAARADLRRIGELSARTDAPLTLSIPPSIARAAPAPADPPTTSEPVATTDAEATEPSPSATPADAEPVTDATAGAAAASSASAAPATSGPAVPAGRLADQIVGDELLGRPFVPLDPSSLVSIGESALFTEQLRRGEDALATAGPHAIRARTVWVSNVPLSLGGADALRDLGVQMVVVPADVAAAMGVTGRTFAIDLGDGATLAGAVISPLGEQLTAPVDGRSASSAAIRLLVEAILDRDDGSAGLVLATGASGVPDPAVTAAFVRYANATPGVSVVGASKLAGVVGTAGRDDIVTASAQPAVDLSARSAAIESLRPSADAAASMLVDPAPATAWDDDFVRVLATTIDDEEAARRTAAIGADIDRYLDAVVLPERFTFGITGTSSELPLRIGNTSDQPLNVIVRVASPKLETEDVATELLPGENVVKIPLTARSNGTFSVEVAVLTPTTNIEVARPVVLKADVTGLSGVSRVVTIGALLALASWWYSHFRKRRRMRRGDTEPAVRLEPGPTLSPDAAESRGPD